jgi:CAAX prenyl protease-like protein
MLATAVSGGFEWLYPLRFIAVVGVLWIYRAKYRALDWQFGWFGVAIGVLVFALWMGCDFLFAKAGEDAMPKALAAASTGARITWIVFRALAAIVTVPIAEELAFRGFAIRRLISENIDELPATSYTWIGLAASSIAFGVMHGNMWFAGILAGVCYAWALIRKGRIGEAVVAHATTNALLAAYVLYFQKWHLW